MKYAHEVRVVRRLALALFALSAPACGDDGDAVPTYAEVATILGTDGAGQSSCSLAGCHGAASGQAELVLMDGTNLITTMVGVAACEAPALPLVDPGNPEGSWLYIKLTGEIVDTATGTLVPDPSWGQAATDCPNTAGFGTRMPQGTGFATLPDEQLTIIYEWIKGGAPGPM